MAGTPASSREVGTSLIADGAVTAAKFASGIMPWTELFDSTLGADAASIDTGAGGFSTSLDHLLVMILARTAQVAVFSSLQITLNNDSGANYDTQNLRARNVTVDASPTAAASALGPNAPGDSVAATVFGGVMLWIPSYAQTTAQKVVIEWSGWGEDTAAEEGVHMRAHRWRNTAAISRLIMTGGGGANLRAGTRMTVYGIG